MGSSGQRRISEMTADEVVLACEQNYIDYWRSATIASAVEWSQEDGITRCVTGLPQEIFNVVLYSNLDETNMGTRVDKAIEEFKARRIPLIWHVGRTTSPASLSAYLEARGYPKDYELIAMAADLTGTRPWQEARNCIEVRRCESFEDHAAWISCLTSSWDSPDPVGEWMLANPFFVEPRPNPAMYLGLIDGSPCGAVMVLASGGVAGLQCVGTIKSAQRKGLGEALVRTAVKDALAEEHKFMVVLSTVEGVPLYKKAGFKAYGALPEHGMYFDRLTP